MATIEQPQLDADRLNEFVGRVVGEIGATLNAALVVIGDRLGLYKAMAGAGPLSPAELAGRTGTAERYVREWLNAQAAGGYVDLRPGCGTLHAARPSRRSRSADEDSPAFLAGFFQIAAATVRDAPKIAEAFRSGEGVGWHEHDHDVFARQRAVLPARLPRQPRRRVDPGARRRRGQAAQRRQGGRRRLRPRRLDDPHGRGLSRSRRSSASTTTRESIATAARARPARPAVATACASRSAPPKDFPGQRLRPGRLLRLPARHGRPGRRRAPRPRSRSPRRHLDDRRALRRRPRRGQPQPGRRASTTRLSTLICTPASLCQEVGARARRPGRRGAAARGRPRGRLHALPPRHRDAVQPRARGAALSGPSRLEDTCMTESPAFPFELREAGRCPRMRSAARPLTCSGGAGRDAAVDLAPGDGDTQDDAIP